MTVWVSFFLISCKSTTAINNADNSELYNKLYIQTEPEGKDIVLMREHVSKGMLKIGYSQDEVNNSINDMDKEEIEFLYNNPKAIKRSGAVLAVLAILGLGILITGLVKACDSSNTTYDDTEYEDTSDETYDDETYEDDTYDDYTYDESYDDYTLEEDDTPKTYTETVECPECLGTGKEICPTCKGTGDWGDIHDDTGESAICFDCDGTGETGYTCSYCEGSGTIEREVQLNE